MAARRRKVIRNYVIVRGKRVYGAAAEAVEKKRSRRRRKYAHGKSCRHPGEYKPGGGRYEKKTCVPRRKSRKRHRAGQFKPGGGRYVTTSGGRKAKKRKRAVRGTAEMSIF